MTYVVTKYIKGNPYLYEVKSVREGDRVRQVFVRYLGRADKPGREYTEPVERRERIKRPAVARAVSEAVAPTEVKPLTEEKPTLPISAITVGQLSKRYGLNIEISKGTEGGEYTGGTVFIGDVTTPVQAFAANWIDKNAPDFRTSKNYPKNVTSEAHEVAHGLFAKNPEAGQQALAELKALGIPSDVAFESLVDIGGLYLLEPNAITNPKIRSTMSKWLADVSTVEERQRQEDTEAEDHYYKRLQELGTTKGVKKGQIEIASFPGWEKGARPTGEEIYTKPKVMKQVEGYDIGNGIGVAISGEGKYKGYTVTHLPTGLAMGHEWKNLKEAIALAKAEAEITDWSQYKTEKDIPKPIMDSASALVRGFTQHKLEQPAIPKDVTPIEVAPRAVAPPVEVKRESLTLKQNIAKAVEERPSRISHGYTAKNAFYITKDNRIIPADEFSQVSRGDDIISVHSHSGENWEQYTREHGQESFQPPNAADFDHLRWLVKQGYGNKLAVIMGDGRYIQVEIPEPAQPRFTRMGVKTLEKRLYPESRGTSDAEYVAKLKEAAKEEGWLLTEGDWKD